MADSDPPMHGDAPIRVLYVNHTDIVGGAERVLLDVLQSLPESVQPHVACPPGELSSRVLSLGVPFTPISGTDASFRLSPWNTARGLANLGRSAVQIRQNAARTRANLV